MRRDLKTLNTDKTSGQSGNLFEELRDLAQAMDEKIKLAGKNEKHALVPVLEAIRADMQKWITSFERSLVTFQEAYEEVTALHVFTEMYLKVEDK